jgi:hypothetical protein
VPEPVPGVAALACGVSKDGRRSMGVSPSEQVRSSVFPSGDTRLEGSGRRFASGGASRCAGPSSVCWRVATSARARLATLGNVGDVEMINCGVRASWTSLNTAGYSTNQVVRCLQVRSVRSSW